MTNVAWRTKGEYIKNCNCICMLAGMEYKEFYVAQSVVLKGTGPVKFDYKNTHSSLADVEHTEKGLQA